MGGANGKILGEEKQAAPAEYYHGNQDAENAGKDGQQHQFLVRFQDCETLPDKFPGLGDPSDRDTVVDPALNVVGVEGLSVADSSILPSIPRANTNLTSMMIGYRAARFLLASG